MEDINASATTTTTTNIGGYGGLGIKNHAFVIEYTSAESTIIGNEF